MKSFNWRILEINLNFRLSSFWAASGNIANFPSKKESWDVCRWVAQNKVSEVELLLLNKLRWLIVYHLNYYALKLACLMKDVVDTNWLMVDISLTDKLFNKSCYVIFACLFKVGDILLSLVIFYRSQSHSIVAVKLRQTLIEMFIWVVDIPDLPAWSDLASLSRNCWPWRFWEL